jgi:hypothetical protein
MWRRGFREMESKTISEHLFERFCQEKSINFRRLDVSNLPDIKTPDYEIFTSGGSIIVEVKQLDPNEEDKRLYNQLLNEDDVDVRRQVPGSRIRGKISDAMPQLKIAAKEGKPALIALYSNLILDAKQIDPYDVLTAMYGLETATIIVPPHASKKPYLKHVKFGGKKKVAPEFNTTLSAILTLYEDWGSHELFASIFHNVYAAHGLDPNVIRGLKIRHFSLPTKDGKIFKEWIEI